MQKKHQHNSNKRIEVKTTSNGGLFVDASTLIRSQAVREEIERLAKRQTAHEQRQAKEQSSEQPTK